MARTKMTAEEFRKQEFGAVGREPLPVGGLLLVVAICAVAAAIAKVVGRRTLSSDFIR